MDQITTEYKNRALILHPDKNIGDSGSLEKFKELQEAKEVLTDPAMRKKYDNWLNSGLNLPFKKWLELNKTGQTFHWIKDPVTKPMIQGEEPVSREEMVTIETNPVTWESDTRSDLIRKFRNYDI